MPTELIQCGVSTPMLQNVVYALPAAATFLHAMNAIEISDDGITFVASPASATTGIQTAAGYARCTTGATKIMCKKV